MKSLQGTEAEITSNKRRCPNKIPVKCYYIIVKIIKIIRTASKDLPSSEACITRSTFRRFK
jgi:hypothetical protein